MFTAWAAATLYLAFTGAQFAVMLREGEGTDITLPAIWASSAGLLLPILAAFFTMRSWADERASGRIDLILTAPVRERDLALGKFLGCWCGVLLVLLISIGFTRLSLTHCAGLDEAALGSWWNFMPAFFALATQGFLWCAVGSFASAAFKQASTAAFVTLSFTLFFPWVGYRLLVEWFPAIRERFPEFPIQTYWTDCAEGVVPVTLTIFFIFFSLAALFGTIKALAFTRLTGRGGRWLRISTIYVVLLGFVFATLVTLFVSSFGLAWNLPFTQNSRAFSARTLQTLADLYGDVRVTCYLSRRAPEYRAVSRLLRGFERAAHSGAGAKLKVVFVDPRWDVGAAGRFVRTNTTEGTLIFERGHRRIDVPVAEVSEAACVAALRRLMPTARSVEICFTTGHGEASFESYDPIAGMSDAARELMREGYILKHLDISAESIPSSCAVLIVAGARKAFAAAELARIETYLRRGGRLLAFVSPAISEGVTPLLKHWGIALDTFDLAGIRTLDGDDAVATLFADHAVSRPLWGCTTVFSAGSTAFSACAHDDLIFTPLASAVTKNGARKMPLAVAVERGKVAAADIAFRPTRVAAIGDTSFVLNGAMRARANANRDLFRNLVSWLAGLDNMTPSASPTRILATGISRLERLRLVLWIVFILPAILFACGWCFFFGRRRSA